MPSTSLPPLEWLDPAQVWQPWEPDDRQPWNLKWAGHLYRRAAFGANLDELRDAVKIGHKAALARFLEPDPEKDKAFLQTAEMTGRATASLRNTFKLRAWWVWCMLQSPNPLREKMTLFWHNHFATSIVKVDRTEPMYLQNQLLRRNALEKFGPLLQQISTDPAMMIYLDSKENVKGKPNENYAREVMELFSLGVGNYTEKDIREAARAFTGWQLENNEHDFHSVFEEELHDHGVKTVLGRTGTWKGEDVVRICLEQDACARFLVRKLYTYFISESPEPPAALLEPLCQQFRKSDYDVGALVGTMLRSRLFFSDYAYRRKIKSPVEFALGTVLAVTARPVPVPPGALVSRMAQMGQALFAPPNVKGWPGGRSWLTTSTVLARHNFSQQVAGGTLHQNPNDGRFNDYERFQAEFIEADEAAEEARQAAAAKNAKNGGPRPSEPAAQAQLDAAVLVRAEKVTEPAGIAKLLTDLLLQGETHDGAQSRLAGFLQEGKPQGEEFNRRVRAAVHALMTMPEYQLA